MSKSAKVILIIAVVLIAISAAYYFLIYKKSNASSTDDQKESLVNQIIEKYGSDPNFDASKEILLTKDIAYLQGILNGTIH